MDREKIGSRLGFLLIAAGCAVGLGNVWRFPFIVGQNGGGAFVLIYLFFLMLLGFPLLMAELALGRASKCGVAGALRTLATPRSKQLWGRIGVIIFSGNLLLMMYYTTVSSWLLDYMAQYVAFGSPVAPDGDAATAFQRMLDTPSAGITGLLIAVTLSASVCLIGVQRGVERVVKWMMIALLLLLVVLAAKAITLPGAADGIAFYLQPDWGRFMEHPIRATFEAMGQAFFTLSVGVGCMTIFGSYIDRTHSLATESLLIIAIDTFVAFLSGLIIFPVCFSFNVDVSSGPRLIFIALPHIFTNMAGGTIWGAIFFLFLSLAAMTTIIAVFECLIGGVMEERKWTRRRATFTVALAVAILSMPSLLGFSIWSDVHPFGGTKSILECEDFVFSQLFLPLGACVMSLFCFWPMGWGWSAFHQESNAGKGLHIYNGIQWYMRYLLPFILLIVLIGGLLPN